MKPLPEPRRGEPIRAQDEAEKIAQLRRSQLRGSATIGIGSSLSGTLIRELKQTKITLVQLTSEWEQLAPDGWYQAKCADARFHIGTGQPVLDRPLGIYYIVAPEPIGEIDEFLIAFWDNNTSQYIAISSGNDICCDPGFEDDECCPPSFEEPPCSCGGTCGGCGCGCGGGGGGSGNGTLDPITCIAFGYDYCTCQELQGEYPGDNCPLFGVSIVEVDRFGNVLRWWTISAEEYANGSYATWLGQYLPVPRIWFYVNNRIVELYGPPPVSPFDIVPCTGQAAGCGGSGSIAPGSGDIPGGGAFPFQPGIGPISPGGSSPPTGPPGESCLAYWERVCAEAHGAGTPGYFDCVNKSVAVCKGGGQPSTGTIRPASVEDWHAYFEDGFDGTPLPEPASLAAASEAAGPTKTVTATLTTDVNDFNPGPCRILAMQTDGSGLKTITGVSIGQQDGQWLIIENFSTLDNIVLAMESSNSLPSNRFNNGTSLTPVSISPGGIERFIYTSRINRWRRV
jgi:hypothetical protein